MKSERRRGDSLVQYYCQRCGERLGRTNTCMSSETRRLAKYCDKCAQIIAGRRNVERPTAKVWRRYFGCGEYVEYRGQWPAAIKRICEAVEVAA